MVTGCLAQRYEKDLLKELPEIDLLLGVNQYAQLPALIRQALEGKRVSACQDDFGYCEHRRVLTTPSWSAYIRIGEGCSNRCTFCAIPLIRGPYRSRDEEAILREIRELAQQGVREHILVAQDTTRYGTETHAHTTLPDLMKKAAALTAWTGSGCCTAIRTKPAMSCWTCWPITRKPVPTWIFPFSM